MSSYNELTGEMTTLLENLSDSVGRMESAPINRIQQGELHNTVTCNSLKGPHRNKMKGAHCSKRYSDQLLFYNAL